MPKYAKKILLIFIIVFIFFIIAISAFEFFINKGNLTSYVERQINKKTDGTVKIERIFLDLFSGILLENVDFKQNKADNKLGFKCKSISIKYKISELFHHHIRELEIVRPDISLNFNTPETTETNETLIKNLKDSATNYMNLNDFIINDLQINNGAVKFSLNDNLITASHVNIQSNEISPHTTFDATIKGESSISNISSNSPATILSELDLKLQYNPENDSLLITKNSGVNVSKIGDFILNGEVHDLLKTDNTRLDINVKGKVIESFIDLLKEYGYNALSDSQSDEMHEIEFQLNGDAKKIMNNATTLLTNIYNLNKHGI